MPSSSVDESFSAKARSKYWNDGSTAVVAVIANSKVYVANGKDLSGTSKFSNAKVVLLQLVTVERSLSSLAEQ